MLGAPQDDFPLSPLYCGGGRNFIYPKTWLNKTNIICMTKYHSLRQVRTFCNLGKLTS